MSAAPESPRSDSPSDAPAGPGMAARAGDAAKLWLRRGIGAVIVIAVLIGVYFALKTFIPPWWGRWVGNIVDGSYTKGAWFGVLLGLVFTAVPLMLLVFAARKIRNHMRIAAGAVVLAVVLAIPNLMTLAIVRDNSKAAHDGSRLLTDHAPFFRGATLVGAIIGVVIAIALPILAAVMRRKRAQKKIQKAADKAAARAQKDAAKQQKAAEKAERRGDAPTDAPDASAPSDAPAPSDDDRL